MYVEFVALLACKSALTILLLSRRAFCFTTCVCPCVLSSFWLRSVHLSVGGWSDLACQSGLTVEGYAIRCPARLQEECENRHENRSRIDPKWSQNRPEIDPKSTPNRPRVPKGHPGDARARFRTRFRVPGPPQNLPGASGESQNRPRRTRSSRRGGSRGAAMATRTLNAS